MRRLDTNWSLIQKMQKMYSSIAWKSHASMHYAGSFYSCKETGRLYWPGLKAMVANWVVSGDTVPGLPPEDTVGAESLCCAESLCRNTCISYFRHLELR